VGESKGTTASVICLVYFEIQPAIIRPFPYGHELRPLAWDGACEAIWYVQAVQCMDLIPSRTFEHIPLVLLVSQLIVKHTRAIVFLSIYIYVQGDQNVCKPNDYNTERYK
jgi:hypothetical protein